MRKEDKASTLNRVTDSNKQVTCKMSPCMNTTMPYSKKMTKDTANLFATSIKVPKLKWTQEER